MKLEVVWVMGMLPSLLLVLWALKEGRATSLARFEEDLALKGLKTIEEVDREVEKWKSNSQDSPAMVLGLAALLALLWPMSLASFFYTWCLLCKGQKRSTKRIDHKLANKIAQDLGIKVVPEEALSKAQPREEGLDRGLSKTEGV